MMYKLTIPIEVFWKNFYKNNKSQFTQFNGWY